MAVPESGVEGDHPVVLGADHQVDLGDIAGGQPGLAGAHDRAAVAPAAPVGPDGHVVDPAAVAVVADHRGGHERALVVSGQHRGARPGDRPAQVIPGVVPGSGETGLVPQRDGRVEVRR